MSISSILDEQVLRVALAAVVLSSFGIYSAANVETRKASVLTGRLDDAIPFMPIFSVPYLLYLPYLFFVIGYGIIASRWWANIAASALAVQLAAAAVYRVHQTHVPRPAVHGGDVFSRLTAFIYRHDAPYSCFPSLHVAYALLSLYWSVHLFPAAFPAFAGFTALIILSTLFIKQHSVADVVAGASVTALTLLILGA
ncbi:MAG TPA: phosphatase PAP2 family protein [Candidatus Binatia bacterium]|jgi:hypothetical protein|nr:phosphatase PAP2 family protein [Candidatus Binatia bacterium]